MTDSMLEFNQKFNNGVGVPLRIMFGTKLKESEKMYYMKLYAKPSPSTICFACGKTLTHPVSLLYGVGPECGRHNHIPWFETEEEVQANFERLKQLMGDITWEGWIPKKSFEYIEIACCESKVAM
jgi:hypothetical protein